MIVALTVLALLAPVPVPSTTVAHRVPAGAPAAARSVQDAPAPDKLAATLIALERQSWVAWQKRDGAFFDRFLADDHVEIGIQGVTGKRTVVAGVASPACVVHSYALAGFRFTKLGEATAVLTYYANQDTVCGGSRVPSPAWVSSVYVRRGGRWQNAVYQQTPTTSPAPKDGR